MLLPDLLFVKFEQWQIMSKRIRLTTLWFAGWPLAAAVLCPATFAQQPIASPVPGSPSTAAMTACEAELHADPTSKSAQLCEREATVALALQQRNHGNAEAALDTLERGRRAIPGDVVLLLDLGIQAEAMQHLQRATDVLQQALLLDPDNAKVLYALARVETDRQSFPEAEVHFNRYLQQHPGDATAHYGLGRVYQMQQKTDEARTEFNRSVELKPAQTEAYYQLGQIALNADDDVQAETMFGKVLDRMQNHGGALTGMGILNYRLKKFPLAQQYLERAAAAAPTYQPAHYYLGLTDAKLGQNEASQQELALALKLTNEQQGKSKAVVVQ